MTERRRRTFGPVVLVGLLSGLALAMAGTQPWYESDAKAYDCSSPCVGFSLTRDGVVTPANALGLVVLASWGVVLVGRGRWRRVVAVLGLLASVAAVATVLWAFVALPEDLRELADTASVPVPGLSRSGWFWIGAVASALGVLASASAVRFVRQWPEMGSRYDAGPGPSGSPDVEPSQRSPHDLWKVIDRGGDPTS